MIWAVLYHHFGVHDTCGDWMPWLCNKDNPEALKTLYYPCKVKDIALYAQILEIWNTYCTHKALVHKIYTMDGIQTSVSQGISSLPN
jgi:hypothetical protein